jgi:hypothetical protein
VAGTSRSCGKTQNIIPSFQVQKFFLSRTYQGKLRFFVSFLVGSLLGLAEDVDAPALTEIFSVSGMI